VVRVTVLLLFLLSPFPAAAKSPLQTVRKHVDELLNVLRLDLDETRKKESIRHIANRFFDFNTLSKLTLGRHWKNLTPKQQAQFVKLYRKLLENTYMDKLLAYKDEKIVFDKTLPLTDQRAEVHTTLISSDSKLPIYYKMIKNGGLWKVYDLVIENISLVHNYRSQFAAILRNKTPGQMIEKLRQKITSQ
jgi:phospholipid transport system substrate-binding protein